MLTVGFSSFLVKIPRFLRFFLLFFFMPVVLFAQQQSKHPVVMLTEVLATSGGMGGLEARYPFPPQTLPQMVTAPFGLVGDDTAASLCGPSLFPYAMACYDTFSGALRSMLPLPGTVTTQPFSFDNSVVVGTSKGILMRLRAPAPAQVFGRRRGGSVGEVASPLLTPSPSRVPQWDVRGDFLWGGWARAHVRRLKEHHFDALWANLGSSEFIGTPLKVNDVLLVVSANLFVQAFSWTEGRLLWATRLGTDLPLRMESVSLAAGTREVFVGTPDGSLLALDIKTGSELWRLPIGKVTDRFPAPVAPALVLASGGVVVSSAGGQTLKYVPDQKVVAWTYPVGSLATPVVLGKSLILGSTRGEILALDEGNGSQKWLRQLQKDLPIAGMTLLSEKHLLVVNTEGAVTLLDVQTGALLDSLSPRGQVVGAFVSLPQGRGACASFANGSVRCWNIK